MISAIALAVQREDDDVVGDEGVPANVPRVVAERRLAVGAGRRSDASARRPTAAGCARNAPIRVAAAEPGRDRRHRQDGVLGEQRDDRVDVGALPGGDEAVDDLAQPAVAERAQRRLLAARREALVDGLVRALQRAVDRRGRRVEGRRDLPAPRSRARRAGSARRAGAPAGAAARDERELDALALLVARLGPGRRVAEPEALVREGLDPDRLDERLGGRIVRVGRRARSRPAARAWAAARSARRQTLVAIGYSHERSELRPSNFARPRHARSSASWSASSASCAEPSMR